MNVPTSLTSITICHCWKYVETGHVGLCLGIVLDLPKSFLNQTIPFFHVELLTLPLALELFLYLIYLSFPRGVLSDLLAFLPV